MGLVMWGFYFVKALLWGKEKTQNWIGLCWSCYKIKSIEHEYNSDVIIAVEARLGEGGL
jgi:hypothetical protein